MMNKVNYYWERFHPLIISSVLSFLFLYSTQMSYLTSIDKTFDSFLSHSLTVSSAMAGFFLTIATIINSIDNKQMKAVKKLGAYPRVERYLMQSIYFHIMVITVTLFYSLINGIEANALSLYLKYVSIDLKLAIQCFFFFCISISWLVSLRFIRIFINLFSNKTDPKKTKNPNTKVISVDDLPKGRNSNGFDD